MSDQTSLDYSGTVWWRNRLSLFIAWIKATLHSKQFKTVRACVCVRVCVRACMRTGSIKICHGRMTESNKGFQQVTRRQHL